MRGWGDVDGSCMMKSSEHSYCLEGVQGSSPGCPSCPGWVLCGKCRNPFVRFKRVGGSGWLIVEVFGAIMAIYGFDFFACRGWGGV